MRAKRALITGINGQDGAYLSDLLIREGYEVYGAQRRLSSVDPWRLRALGLLDQVRMVDFDLIDAVPAIQTLQEVQPDEVYNLGAHSFVATSFRTPVLTSEIDALGVVRLLEILRTFKPDARFYQASSSEMFGNAETVPQNEATRFHPRSPYGVAKLFGHWMTVNYRESYGMHASSGILYNHESPLRGAEFVTRKITRTLAEIKRGRPNPLQIGNLDAARDWGFAGDYVRGMWLMLQGPRGDDYVLATGRLHRVRDLVEAAATILDLAIEWEGEGMREIGRERGTGRVLVSVREEFFRPVEAHTLLGDASKAERLLGWRPEVGFETLVERMVEADLRWLDTGEVRL